MNGIFAAASGHVTRTDPPEQHLTWSTFWVDLGLESRAEVQQTGVFIGGPVVFESAIRHLGPHRIAGCAMDDRVGLAVMEALLSVRERVADLTCELWFAVTIQEEGGMHGASALGHSTGFDRVVGLEVGLVGDMPGLDGNTHPGRLADGPMIVHKDGLVTYDREISRLLYEAAGRSGTPVQDAAFAHYASDGMEYIDTGSPAALIAVPTRYTHTGFEMVDVRDVQASIDLLMAFIT